MWGDRQLDAELARHGWFSIATDDAILFALAPEKRWHRAFAAAGIDVRLLAPASGRA